MNNKNKSGIKINPEEIKRILIINLGGIGDLLLSTPAIRALKKKYPYAEIYLLVTKPVSEFTRALSYINEIFIFNMHFGLIKIWQNLKNLLILRKRKLDLAINMRTLVSKRGALKIKLLLSIINPKAKAGRDTEGRGSFLDIKINEPDIGEKYEMDYDIETVEALGAKVTDRDIDFKIEESVFEKVRQLIGNEGVSLNDTLVGIHLGGKPSHRWPMENFMELLKTINKKIKCRFIITGEIQDSYLANKLMTKTDIKIINLVGRLDFRELGALIKMCSVYISGDTAPMHIAAILKTPLVAIFGPGYMNRFDPRNISDKVAVLYKKVDCAPCNKVFCQSMECLRLISTEEATEAVLNLLK